MNFPADTSTTTATTAVPSAPSAMPSAAGSMAQMAFSLVLVLGVIFALAWVLRWMQGPRAASGNALRLQAGLQVGPKEKIILVQAGDTHLLIGVAPGNVQKLHVFDQAPIIEDGAPVTQPPLPPFAEKLREILQRGRGA